MKKMKCPNGSGSSSHPGWNLTTFHQVQHGRCHSSKKYLEAFSLGLPGAGLALPFWIQNESNQFTKKNQWLQDISTAVLEQQVWAHAHCWHSSYLTVLSWGFDFIIFHPIRPAPPESSKGLLFCWGPLRKASILEHTEQIVELPRVAGVWKHSQNGFIGIWGIEKKQMIELLNFNLAVSYLNAPRLEVESGCVLEPK